MTPKQILDSFSETLMQDERILSAQERALLAALLQHAKASAVGNEQTQEAVRAVIASAVGETVAQRAFSVLGGSIVERILESSPLSIGDATGLHTTDIYAGKTPKAPQPPNKAPQPPNKAPMRTPGDPSSPGSPVGPSPGEPQSPGVRAPHKDPQSPGHAPQPPGAPMRTPGVPSSPGSPVSPSPGEPQSPGVRAPHKETHTHAVSETGIAVAERPAVLPAKSVVLDEFLSPQELEQLTRFTLAHEGDFRASEVVSPTADGGVVNYEHRRSRVLMDLAEHQDLMLDRIKAVLPQVLDRLGMEEFSIAEVEAQVTASNDGDFFCFHSDNASDRVASRTLTFVYFFHREPRQFEGGELRIHDARLQDDAYGSEGSYQAIVPQQNQIVFFPCELLHEITPVNCSSRLFADSRFTLNGWLRQ
jgi:Rps23 Pro-64 3,4-dihydroxylase Tpa1-like proline 4-hydroxylase